MVIFKAKKNKRQRGSKTHGWGSMKKHRGAGNRGGKGNAGTGKRGDANKPSIWKKKYFGKFGFKVKGVKKNINAISLKDLQERLNSYINEKKISKEGDFFMIDMDKLGYNKLLSQGKVLNKLKIKVSYASKKAIEKVNSGGGEITDLVKEKETKKPEE